ncbi:GMC oxidoreductase [Pestalotiopsis sp. NC0098]|nr:GMC oxidoreductase [Pestalotiopsis sp. NC0098]
MKTDTTFARLAQSASLVAAHPAFRGHIVNRRDDLLPAYDYVVIGAGASGLTVANRLSEDDETTVLVIEAGEFDQGEDIVTIPGLAGGAIGTKYDWNISYAPTEYVANNSISIPQGKIVGGSTKLNRMVFDRGSESDYDRWEDLGNQGWGWEALLPYFKKNEIFTPPDAQIASEFNITYDVSAHGYDGYMNVSYAPFIWPTTKVFVDAIEEVGISISPDQANGNAIGGFYTPHNQDPETATRSSAREAYYDTVATRSNLHLITGQQVTRILSNGTGDSVCVTGVEFASGRNASRSSVAVQKEAILAAGAIFTPQILQVSGIGDAAYLSSINVSTIVDLPAVGQNFHDHILLTTVNTIVAPLTASNLTTNATYAAESRELYDTEQTGPYADSTGDFLVFLPLQNFTEQWSTIQTEATAQDLSLYLPKGTAAEVVSGYKRQHEVLTEKLGSTGSAVLEMIWADGAVVLGLEHPYSRGSVNAPSGDIFDAPSADPALLSNPLDVEILVEGIKFVRTLMGADALGPLQPVEVLPGANVTSDADLSSFVRQSASTLYHPAGSCKLGARNEGGVVDGELKVYGIEGLRIVDASVMPLLPASHTMTTVYAVAEKAADIIRGLA